MSATGAAAAALGLSGPAAGMAIMSNEETEEPATRVEFRFGEMLVKGLFWNWPFKEGDSVRVVGRRGKVGNFIALSVLDEQRRLIVSYPYVSSGSWAHWIAVAKYSLALSVPLYMIQIGFFVLDALTGDGLAPLEMIADAYLIWFASTLDTELAVISRGSQRWPMRYSERSVGPTQSASICGGSPSRSDSRATAPPWAIPISSTDHQQLTPRLPSSPHIPIAPPQSPSPAPWPALHQSPGLSGASYPNPAPVPTAPPGAGA